VVIKVLIIIIKPVVAPVIFIVILIMHHLAFAFDGLQTVYKPACAAEEIYSLLLWKVGERSV